MTTITKLIYPDESYAIRGAIYEVYREKGCGFLEAVYQECLERELSRRSVPFKARVPIGLLYKGEPLALELRAFVDCVRNRSEPVVSGEHAAEALKLAVAICQSIRKGQT